MAKAQRKSPRRKPRSASAESQSSATRGGQHIPPRSKQLPEEEVPNTAQDSPGWWKRIRSSNTPGRRGALPQAPDTDDDYDYTKYDFPMWWASIRLDDLVQSAQAVHPAMLIAWSVLAEGSWQMFLRELPDARRHPERKDWSQVPARELVAYVEGMSGIRMGIRYFLPSKYADVPFEERSVLYLRALILWGTIRGGPFPVRPAYEAIRLYEGAPYAIREIIRRGARHVGGYIALLLLNPEDGPTVAKALKGLSKLVYRRLPPATRDRIGRDNYTGRTNPHAALRGEMNRQAFETGKERWGHHGLRGLVLRWLAGKLNIAPQAIADDLQDLDREILGRLRRENLFNEDNIFIDLSEDKHGDDGGDKKTSREAAEAGEVKNRLLDLHKFSLKDVLDNIEVRETLERFLTQHPKHLRGIEAILSDEPLADFARQHGVKTVQTVINWKNRAITTFKKWCFGNGKAAPANINHKRSKGHPREPKSEERKLKQATSIRPDVRARFLAIVEKVKDAEAREAVTPPSPSAS